MKILIKYATRGRAELFKQTIKNIQDTISGEIEYRIEVTCDVDDAQMFSPFEVFENTDKITYRVGTSLSKIHAINRDMDEITKDYNWDILINMSDDMKFVVKDWDKFIVDKVNSIGTLDCFVHISDGYVFDKLPTMSIMGREYYERFFYIYPPCYKSYSCDAEAMFVAQMLGKWHYFSDVLFKHEHPANNVSVNTDETYKRADKHTNHDTEVYFKRMRKLFYVNNPTVIPSVLKNEMEAKGWLN